MIPGPPPDRRAKWARARPGAILQELVAHALLLAFAWYGGLGYFGIVLMMTFEALLIVALAIVLYPERGLWRHLVDILKAGALAAFLLMFVVATYSVAEQGEAEETIAVLRGSLQPSLLGWALGFAAAHQGIMLVYARTTDQPRRTWARLALTQGAVSYLTLFFLVFVAAFLGPVALGIARAASPEVAAGDVLALLAVALRAAFALLMAHIPEHELDRMAKNPYVD